MNNLKCRSITICKKDFDDRSRVLEAIHRNVTDLKYTSDKIKKDKKFILSHEIWDFAIQYLYDELKNDEENLEDLIKDTTLTPLSDNRIL